MIYIATFYSHFGAVRFKRLCESQEISATLMPVPRDLSSSCGTCVRYECNTFFPTTDIPEEIEQIVERKDNCYIQHYRAENS